MCMTSWSGRGGMGFSELRAEEVGLEFYDQRVGMKKEQYRLSGPKEL